MHVEGMAELFSWRGVRSSVAKSGLGGENEGVLVSFEEALGKIRRLIVGIEKIGWVPGPNFHDFSNFLLKKFLFLKISFEKFLLT